MATIVATEVGWHDGEHAMHTLMGVPEGENPTVPYLSTGAGYMLTKAPLLALGTIDKEGRPWSTIWGGERGFARPIANSVMGVTALVDRRYDPVLECLVGTIADGKVIKPNGQGKMVSGLAVDLENRKRVKLFGRMMVGALNNVEEDSTTETERAASAQVQLAVHIDESLGEWFLVSSRRGI
jgi:hypothetical protein